MYTPIPSQPNCSLDALEEMIKLAQFGKALEDEECKIWRLSVGHTVNQLCYARMGLRERVWNESLSQKSDRIKFLHSVEGKLVWLCSRLIDIVEVYLIPCNLNREKILFYYSMSVKLRYLNSAI
jgi:hypothetical protein